MAWCLIKHGDTFNFLLYIIIIIIIIIIYPVLRRNIV
jgi:hypothetical protein